MSEVVDEHQAQAELDRALDVRRQRKADHRRSDFDDGQRAIDWAMPVKLE